MSLILRVGVCIKEGAFGDAVWMGSLSYRCPRGSGSAASLIWAGVLLPVQPNMFCLKRAWPQAGKS